MSGNIQVPDSSNSCGVSINDLPENVLIHIMSLLPMKDAVRTSVLSKKWEHKWTSIFSINISNEQLEEDSFNDFVDRIFLHSQNIQSFHLSCDQMSNPSRLETWISSLSRRNVQSVKISIFDCGDFFLPSCLLENISLTSLELHMPCVMKFPDKGYLCNLKFLSLISVRFQNEHVSGSGLLQLTFPVLETLELRLCEWGSVRFVEINSFALTTFVYMSFRAITKGFLIKVCGRKLEKFEFGTVSLNSFDLSASSVVDVSIRHGIKSVHPFAGGSGSHSRLSIEQFSSLKYLRLLGFINKEYALLKPGLPLPRFDRLQKLDLCVHSSIEAFLELLHMAPTLEQLIIKAPFQRKRDSEVFNFDEVGYLPSCMLSHLAKINFTHFLGTTHELRLVKFLLKNSVKLEKVVLSVHSKSVIPMVYIKEQLSAYPTGSPRISVVIN